MLKTWRYIKYQRYTFFRKEKIVGTLFDIDNNITVTNENKINKHETKMKHHEKDKQVYVLKRLIFGLHVTSPWKPNLSIFHSGNSNSPK